MKEPKPSITDELVNKVKYLHKALDQANTIIATLEQENKRLKDVLTNLASLNNKDLDITIEVTDDRFCTV